MENEQLFNVKKLFDEDLVLLDVSAKNSLELLEQLSDFALKKDLVYPSFKEAVVARERNFPTGLQMPAMRIAIPHTDSKHVKSPHVIVAKLKEPVLFKEMGLEENDILVDLVFMLLINNDGHQVFLLQNIMNLCMNEKISNELLNLNTKKGIYDLIQHYYETYAEYLED